MNIEKQSHKAVQRHFNNIKLRSKRELSRKELDIMYSYLDYCWICEKDFTFWDKISFNLIHGFEGNQHRRKCY